MGTIAEKAGGRRAGSGREKRVPACRPLAFSIVLTEREPGTGYLGEGCHVYRHQHGAMTSCEADHFHSQKPKFM